MWIINFYYLPITLAWFLHGVKLLYEENLVEISK